MAKIGLCIGINNYPGSKYDLGGCVNDACDWAEALDKRGFRTTQLIDNAATGDGIRTAIKRCFSRARTGDSVIITFSGHGSQVEDVDGDEADGTDECICPHDVTKKEPITDDELYDLFKARVAGVRFVFIADSCNSGDIRKALPSSMRARPRFMPPAVFGAPVELSTASAKRFRRASPPGRSSGLFLSGCRADESSYDDSFGGRANGAFTFVALRTLLDLPPNATYSEWFKRIRRELPSKDHKQTPTLDGTQAMKHWRVLS
jgi:hypothetical protein